MREADIQGNLHLGQGEGPIFPSEGSGGLGGSLLTMLLLACGIPGSAFKEINKGAIQVS
jgi:hypothetical protein